MMRSSFSEDSYREGIAFGGCFDEFTYPFFHGFFSFFGDRECVTDFSKEFFFVCGLCDSGAFIPGLSRGEGVVVEEDICAVYGALANGTF